MVDTAIKTPNWKPGDTERAKALWAEYLARNDISGQLDLTAGIDPDTGHVWFGTSALDIWEQQRKVGTPRPLYYVRVGKDYYITKGGRR